MIRLIRICQSLAIAALFCQTLANAENVGVMADATTGEVYPAVLEARIASGGGGGGGGGGGMGWGEGCYTTTNLAMTPSGNGYVAFALDTTSNDVTLTLSSQTNFQSVVVRKISNLHEAKIVGTTTNTLTYDGQTLILDYWPALSNWYWRTY
jgi:hypothetical protein